MCNVCLPLVNGTAGWGRADTRSGLLHLLLVGGERTRWQHVMWPTMSVGLSRAGWHSTSLGCTDAKLMPRVQPRVSNSSQTVKFVTCCDCWVKCFPSLQHFRLAAVVLFFFLTANIGVFKVLCLYSTWVCVRSTLKDITVPMRNSVQVSLFLVTFSTQGQ